MSTILTITDSEAVEAALSETLGSALDDVTAVAELLRHELFARGTSTRRAVCQRVHTQLSAFADWEAEQVRKILDDLDRAGDVSTAPGGRIAPAPLRLVDTGGGRYALFGGIPRSQLEEYFENAEMSSEGILRWLTIGQDETAELIEPVSLAGGAILSIDRWSGLDRVTPCGKGYLEQLSSRFEFEKVAPDTWDPESLDGWSTYMPDSSIPTQRRRWIRSSKKGAEGKLWRSHHVGGWWVYAWCEAGSPENAPSLKLRQDDALRASYSLDAVAEAPLELSFSREDTVELVVDAFLPLAEFRFLNVSGSQSRDEHGSYRYLFTSDTWAKVSTMLQTRLGVQLTETTP